MKKILILLVLWDIPCSYGQVFPGDNIKLNYTQVMFDFPEVGNASQYMVQISENGKESFFNRNNYNFIQKKDSANAIMVSGLNFGKQYSWRYLAYDITGKEVFHSDFFFFETLKYNPSETYKFNAKVISQKVNDGLIFLDDSKTAIDRAGNPVWFLPNENINIQDLKMNSSGTITFIVQNGPWGEGRETDINGNILWQTPSGRKSPNRRIVRPT